MKDNFYGLWYEEPAASWMEALPLGNGKIGAMERGGIQHEIITLNEETVWDGFKKDRTNPNAYDNLQEIRKAIFSGEYEEAEKIGEGMLGIPETLDSYQPLCDLEIRNYHTGLFWEYKRGLDLNQAVHTVEYRQSGVISEYGRWYRRESFVSAPDQMMLMYWSTDYENGMNLDIRMTRMNPVDCQVKGQEILLTGRCCEGGTAFAALLRIKAREGQIYSEGDTLKIRNGQDVEFRITAASDYDGTDAVMKCRKNMKAAEEKTYEEMLQRHTADYRGYFDRQKLQIGGRKPERIPDVNHLLECFRKGEQKEILYVLMYHYLRYLIISSSRQGTMPSNLQGIWNDNMKAPWNSDYHPNVNMQINYWPVEGYGLPECVEPLFPWLMQNIASGEKTAYEHYRADGWVLHHISDIYGCTTPMDGPWGLWPFGGSWLSRHAYEHYLYTGDREFLKETALPLVEGSVRFMLDFLMECPEGIPGEGFLVTCPSHSPENRFIDRNGKVSWLTYASTMDMELIWDLFTIYLKISEILDFSNSLTETVKNAKERLVPLIISEKTGCIQEWIEDYQEEDPGHRHVSHLFGLYPGFQITENTPEFMDASEKTLERRLSYEYDGQGWSYGWIANLFARLKKGNRAVEMIDCIVDRLLMKNLMVNAHGNPQVGDAQAIAAAIQEMLIQSHTEQIELLPALPEKWDEGMVEGICSRGGFIWNLYWKDGKITEANVTARYDNSVCVKTTLEKVYGKDGDCVAERDSRTGLIKLKILAGQTMYFRKN